jgi:hypothetical protein
MSDYEIRKKWRTKLNNKRNSDKDHSAKRYSRDASVLNRAMRMFGVEGRVANW